MTRMPSYSACLMGVTMMRCLSHRCDGERAGSMPSMPTVPMAPAWAGSKLVKIRTRGCRAQPFGPASAQVAQPRGLALHADRLVETRAPRRWRWRWPPGACRLPRTSGCRPTVARPAGRQRPQARDQLAPHVEEAGADRGEQPLVQAGAVVVALEVARARTGSARRRARRRRSCGCRGRVAMRQIVWTGKICPVRFVMWQTWITFVRGVTAALEPLREVGQRGRRHREADLLQDDAVAAHALLPGVEHRGRSPGWS